MPCRRSASSAFAIRVAVPPPAKSMLRRVGRVDGPRAVLVPLPKGLARTLDADRAGRCKELRLDRIRVESDERERAFAAQAIRRPAE